MIQSIPLRNIGKPRVLKDELNVVVDPLFVEIAERNVKEFDVVPLFYDAEKAPPEILSRETQFKGLSRAHEFSSGDKVSIGKISNMLTRLWNKDHPDRIAAAWITMLNNLAIDAAKTGKINHYKQYPKIARKISKAIGGEKGNLPYWYQFSKNGRRDAKYGQKKRKYLEPNNSTMNRICAAFNDIGNINLHKMSIRPFNWQMLMPGPYGKTDYEVGLYFCELDRTNTSNVIEAQELDYAPDREAKAGYQLLAELIAEEMTDKFGPLEKHYPHILKYLFADESSTRIAGKQMFWRVYGHIALEALKKNLKNCYICDDCGARIPNWVKDHICPKSACGFLKCIDCSKVVPRMNSRQCRCSGCQEAYSRMCRIGANQKYHKARADRRAEMRRKKQANLNGG